MLEKSWGAPTVINSGVVVAKELELADRFENLGAQMVREMAAKTSEVAGDGTTTATLLAAAIVNEGMKYVAAGTELCILHASRRKPASPKAPSATRPARAPRGALF